MKSSTVRRLAATGIAGGMLVAGTGLASAGHLNPLLESDLSGRNEVSTDARSNRIAGDPNGRGEGYVFGIDDDVLASGETVENDDTLCYVLIVEGIDGLDEAPLAGVRMAHLHEGAAGENGPVVANLAFPQDGQAADCISEDEVGKFPTGEAGIVQRILANPDDFYFNVHNEEYPNGAVRGQLAEQGHGDHDH